MPDEMLFIENLDELLDILAKRFPQEFQQAAQVAMTKSAVDVEGWAKQNAPVDTGRLRSSIASKVETAFGEIQGVIGTNVKYAEHVEAPGNVRRTGRRPWLRPAVEEHQQEILKNFEGIFSELAKRLGL
jgi:phage gpG-like protein